MGFVPSVPVLTHSYILAHGIPGIERSPLASVGQVLRALKTPSLNLPNAGGTQAPRIVQTGGAVVHVAIEVVTADEPDWIFGDEPAQALVVVTCTVVGDPGLWVEVSPSELERVCERSRRSCKLAECIVRVRYLQELLPSCSAK